MRMRTVLGATCMVCATTTHSVMAGTANIKETSRVVGDSDYAVRTAAMIATGKALASARAMGMSTFALRRAVLQNGEVSVEIVASGDATSAELELAPPTPGPTDALPNR